MKNVLLIEPAYRSKFPPLGLLRLATHHKDRGDSVTFARGKCDDVRAIPWHRIYVSSLFTYELPRTIETIRYYSKSVERPEENLIVGGIAATLLPQYIRDRVKCRVIEGPLAKAGMVDKSEVIVANCPPDYGIVDASEWAYRPADSYFCRVSTGCIRHCSFCAVPKLEPKFGLLQSLASQINTVKKRFGERQHLVLLDNNILALDSLDRVVQQIQGAGFEKGAKRNGRQRTIDFNQGIDARLITAAARAKQLASICVDPVRLAFDYDGIEHEYRRAVTLLANEGFGAFTNYVMFNFKDDPRSFYHRLKVGIELSDELDIRVTGFPMRFIPIDDVTRRYVAPKWRWRYLRGIQCILLATHGMVSPHGEFFEAAFGASVEEFLQIVAMPDRYIVHRKRYRDKAKDWHRLYRRLSSDDREKFLALLSVLNRSRQRKDLMRQCPQRFRVLLEHYYPGGLTPHG